MMNPAQIRDSPVAHARKLFERNLNAPALVGVAPL
jgi:hypothetical protein